MSLPAPLSLSVLAETGSTNSDLKQLARQGAPAGTALLARRQTGGRGRMGKTFCSPEGGLYLSLLLRPNSSAVKAASLTAAAAVAVCRVLEKQGVCGPRIKWVNDIFLRDKKICGILAESALNPDGTAQWVVVGVGLNLVPPAGGWPEELRGIAGAAFDRCGGACFDAIAGQLLTELWDLCRRPESREILQEYKARSLVPGREITVLQGETTRQAKALAIDDKYRLLVQYEDGSSAALDSGLISVKL